MSAPALFVPAAAACDSSARLLQAAVARGTAGAGVDMAARSLTDVFLLMRNNAQQTRHMYSRRGSGDQESLVPREDDLEAGSPPPAWLHTVQEVQFAARDIQERLSELADLRQRHLTRPTLDDSTADEQRIEALQHDITDALARAQRATQQVQRAGRAAGSQSEARLNKTVVLALATRLQELSGEFRSSQGTYLRQHQQREQRSQSYFDAMIYEDDASAADTVADRAFMQQGAPMSEQELLQLEENTAALRQRDTEVQELVRSITELNAIFRDLAQMVADQGQVVDRIDVNVENTQVKVTQGARQLQKADQHQRRGRKMTCIFGLAGAIVLLLIILISVKS